MNKRRTMTAAARRRIAAIQQQRWAAYRSAKLSRGMGKGGPSDGSGGVRGLETGAQQEAGTAAELWDIGNRAEAKVEQLGRKAMPFMLVAGAAFHLAKAEVAHGEWEKLVAACSSISLRIVQQRMQTTENALRKLGYTPEPRAFETIVFSSKIAKARDRALLETPFARQLTSDLNDVFAGKNAHQIELDLGIRAPKKPRALTPATEEDVEKRDREAAVAAVQRLRESVNTVRNLAGHLDKVHWNDVAWSCLEGLVHCLPEGWPIEVQPPNGQPRMTIQEMLEKHVGARRTS